MSINIKTADGLVNLGVTNSPTPHWFGTMDEYVAAKKRNEIPVDTVVFIDESAPYEGTPAVNTEVLNGKEFFDAAGRLQVGSMPDYGGYDKQHIKKASQVVQGGNAENGYTIKYKIPAAGYYNEDSYIYGDAKDFGDAPDYAVVEGYTFTSKDGLRKSGIITDNGSYTTIATTYGRQYIPYGYHDGSGYIDTSLLGDRRIDGKVITIPFSNSLDTGLKSTAGGTIGATGSVSGTLKIQLYFDDDNALKVKIYSNDTNITIQGKARVDNDYGIFNYVSNSKTEKLNLSSEPVIS